MDVNQAVAPALLEVNTTPVLALPPGWTHQLLEKLAAKQHVQTPGLIDESVIVQDNQSFAYYLSRFATPDTLYSVSRSQQNVMAELDYHQNATTPGHNKHVITRKFNLSKRFQAWKDHNKKVFTQTDFANFLEDRISDLSVSEGAETSQAELHGAVRQFQAVQNSQFNSAVNQANGDVEFQFTVNTQVVSLTLPTRLLLGMQIYEFGSYVEFGARLKYRPKDGVVSFWYELIRIEEFLDDVFTGEVENLRRLISPGAGDVAPKTFILND